MIEDNPIVRAIRQHYAATGKPPHIREIEEFVDFTKAGGRGRVLAALQYAATTQAPAAKPDHPGPLVERIIKALMAAHEIPDATEDGEEGLMCATPAELRKTILGALG